MKTIIAIDPGRSGGLAVCYPDAKTIGETMPDTEADLVDFLAGTKHSAEAVVAYVEKVGGFAGKAQPGSAMFKFGFGCGVIEGSLRALGIRTIYVRPQEWQKHFSLGTARSCANKTEWKAKLKAEAQRRFPGIKVTLAIADALLILDFARSKEL